MKPTHIILLGGCFTILSLDALASIASRRLNFNYARLAPLSFVIYAAIGFAGTRVADQTTGIVLAAAVGFSDATIGWQISMMLKANTGSVGNNPSVSRWVLTAIFVTLVAAICGLAGSELLRLIR